MYVDHYYRYRLESLIFGSIAIPIGLFIYGWTAEYHVHSAVPIVGTAFVGFGVMFTFVRISLRDRRALVDLFIDKANPLQIPTQVYMVDAYTKYAASAIAASSILRSIAGSILPLAGVPLYDRLGLGWGNSVLAFIALGLGALPVLFCKYGEHLRVKFSIEFD